MSRRQVSKGKKKRRTRPEHMAEDAAAREEAQQHHALQLGQEIKVSVGGPESPMYIVFSGNSTETTVYCVDKNSCMTYSTRQYVTNLVVAALKLGSTFNSWYEHPPIDQLKQAVGFLVGNIDYLQLHTILGSIEPRDSYSGDISGSIELNGWDLDADWLTIL